MPTLSPPEITRLLKDWSGGDRSALDRLIPLVHAELRRIARRQMSLERADHTLQATALVNEAYVRLAGDAGPRWQNRAHFFAVCAQVMRHVLIDHARTRAREKRGETPTPEMVAAAPEEGALRPAVAAALLAASLASLSLSQESNG